MQTFQQKNLLKKSEKIEVKTGSEYLLDSCIWIGYFTGDTPKTKEIIESDQNNNFTSILTIFELMVKMKNMKMPKIIIENMTDIIENNSTLLTLDKDIVKNASENTKKHNLFAMDSLLYSTAESKGLIFVTADKHFSKTPKTNII